MPTDGCRNNGGSAGLLSSISSRPTTELAVTWSKKVLISLSSAALQQEQFHWCWKCSACGSKLELCWFGRGCGGFCVNHSSLVPHIGVHMNGSVLLRVMLSQLLPTARPHLCTPGKMVQLEIHQPC